MHLSAVGVSNNDKDPCLGKCPVVEDWKGGLSYESYMCCKLILVCVRLNELLLLFFLEYFSGCLVFWGTKCASVRFSVCSPEAIDSI